MFLPCCGLCCRLFQTYVDNFESPFGCRGGVVEELGCDRAASVSTQFVLCLRAVYKELSPHRRLENRMMGSVVDQVGPALEFVKSHVVLDGPMFRLALLLIFASPTWWNVGGRVEHKLRIFRKVFLGNKYVACYFFAFTVFTLSAIRNYVYPLTPFALHPGVPFCAHCMLHLHASRHTAVD